MIKVYWGDIPMNFGDVLNANLLNYLQIPFKHCNKPEDANTFIIGSIARLASANNNVLGSGIIRMEEKINPDANFKFVRGPLTRQAVLDAGGNCPEIYGDPALLLSEFCEESNKEYEIGIVPHYKNYSEFKRKYQDKFHVINVVNKDPLTVAKEITKCKKIISSSLHGIICAHAYGIPAARVVGKNKVFGDGIKFEDYYKSVNADYELSTVANPKFTDANLPNLEIIKEYLQDL